MPVAIPSPHNTNPLQFSDNQYRALLSHIETILNTPVSDEAISKLGEATVKIHEFYMYERTRYFYAVGQSIWEVLSTDQLSQRAGGLTDQILFREYHKPFTRLTSTTTTTIDWLLRIMTLFCYWTDRLLDLPVIHQNGHYYAFCSHTQRRGSIHIDRLYDHLINRTFPDLYGALNISTTTTRVGAYY